MVELHECFNNSDCSWTPVSTAAIMKTNKPASDDRWQFCGYNVHTTILGANICDSKCTDNGYSIKKLMQRWSQSMLHSTYYKVAHHGAWTTYTSLECSVLNVSSCTVSKLCT